MKRLIFLLLLSLSISRSALAQVEHAGSELGQAAESEHQESAAATVFRWVNFVILFGGLGYLLRKPAKEFFEARRRDIAEGLNRARNAQAEAQRRLGEIEKRLGQLSAEMTELRAQAEKESVLERERIVTEAKADVNRVVEQARQEIERVARSVEREIKEHLADQVIDRASQTLQTQMTQDDHKRVVVRFIKNL